MGLQRYPLPAFIALMLLSLKPAFATETVIVEIINFKFIPEQVTIKSGTTIRWINKDGVDHDVTSGTAITGRAARNADKIKHPDGKFQSGLFSNTYTYEFTFNLTGEYPYFCNIHPFMAGKVVVE